MTHTAASESTSVPESQSVHAPQGTETTPNAPFIRALNACIETCVDGQKGYGSAAADVRDPALKALCEESAHQRGTFVVALQAAVRQLGGLPENEGTFRGPLHRSWMSLRRAVQVHDDTVVLEGCAEGEKAAIAAYEAADRAVLSPAPVEVRALIQAQYAAIQRAHADLRARLAPPG